MNYANALRRLEGISDEIHVRRELRNKAMNELEASGCESPDINSSPPITRRLQQLNLDMQSPSSPQNSRWYYKDSPRINGDREEESNADSLDTLDTLDDSAIDNLRLEKALDFEITEMTKQEEKVENNLTNEAIKDDNERKDSE